MKDLSKVKCVIFDWDGTLVSCEKMVHAAYVLTFDKLGDKRAQTWELSDTHMQNGRARQDIFADKTIWGENGQRAEEIFYQIYPRLQQDDPALNDRYETLRGEKLEKLSVYDGADELLSYMFKNLFSSKIVLLGAKNETLLRHEVEQTHMTPHFDEILGNTGDKLTDKPAPGAFDRAVEGVNITDKASEVLYIGDNAEKDTAFAKSWGADVMIINPREDKTILRSLLNKLETNRKIARQARLSENGGLQRQK